MNLHQCTMTNAKLLKIVNCPSSAVAVQPLRSPTLHSYGDGARMDKLKIVYEGGV